MKNELPKLSVIIITYNQEAVIGRAIESLLCQKDYIYEIIISDDCSTDNNWRVISEYAEKYPDLIRPYQNKNNRGIFENYEVTWKLPQGDMVYQLEGDDTCEPGYFEKVFTLIEEKKIDVYNELFCIYGDYKVIYPNGDSLVRKNDLVTKNINIIKLSMRVLISNRSTVFSRKIMDKYVECSQGRSHIAENAQDRQLQVFTEKVYYHPYVGNNYYGDYGVSTKINEERFLERQQIMPYTKVLFDKLGVELDKKDVAYFDYYAYFYRSRQHPSLKNYFLRYVYFIKSIDPAIGLRGLDIKHVIFAVLRRLPHKKPIHM